MREAFRATAILASGSAVTIVVSVVTAKAWALLVGPTGVGLLALMHSAVSLGTLLASAGVGVALVRLGARGIAAGEHDDVAILRYSAERITLLLALLSVVVFLAFRDSLGQWLLGEGTVTAAMLALAAALAVSLVSGMQTSVLNAHHRVGSLARFAVFNSVLGAPVGILLIAVGGIYAIPYAVLATCAVGWAVSTWLVRREVPFRGPAPSLRRIREAVRSLLSLGLPYTASAVFGSGIQLALPFLVLHLLDTDNVGYYRAAVAISTGYLGFLLTALAQDYYPRISAVSQRPERLHTLINEQLKLVTLIMLPVLLAAQVLTPILIPLLYAPNFAPAGAVLEWHLVGNLFRFWSWVLSFVVLAAARPRMYFVMEMIGGLALLATSWIGLALFGLEGIGIGFLVGYIFYFGLVWFLVRDVVRPVFTLASLRLMSLSLAGSVLIFALPRLGGELARYSIGIAVVFVVAAVSGQILWKNVRRVQPTTVP